MNYNRVEFMYVHSTVKFIRLKFSYMKNDSKIPVDLSWILQVSFLNWILPFLIDILLFDIL